MSPLEAALERLTIADVAAQLFPGWKAGKSCKSPFREDRHASFSVFDEGRKWKDHATDEHGDLVDFVVKANGLSKSDASRELIRLAGTERPKLTPKAKKAKADLPPMPEGCRQLWNEGTAHLLGSESQQHVIDQWRGWPAGTVRTLAEDGVIACPLIDGQRGISFTVQAPFRDELGLLSTRDVGFHFRAKQKSGERVRWKYFPNDAEHGASCPALPFVLGAGFLPFAQTVIVTEGQWDAVTLCAAAGWLTSDAAWPERIAVFGTRGASAWRTLIDSWGGFWKPAVRFVLFADADEAGDRWKAPGGFVETLLKLGHPVRLLRSTDAAAKDLNEIHKRHPITPEKVAVWLAPKTP